MQLATYYFDYPSVDDLLSNIYLDGNFDFIDARGRQGLRIAGMINVDDFTMISPLDLCLVSRIQPEKVVVLFALVEKTIEAVHQEKKEEISDIKEYTQRA